MTAPATSRPTAGEARAQLRTRRLSTVVGGPLNDSIRDEIAAGTHPRVDVVDMETEFGAATYDFREIKRDLRPRSGVRARALHWLAAKTGRSSAQLALSLLERVRDDDLVYATGEDIGFPLAAAMRWLGIDGPRLVVRVEDIPRGRTGPKQTIGSSLARYALGRVDLAVPRTTAMAHYLYSIHRVPLERLNVALQPTDPVFYSPGAPTAPAFDPPAEPYVFSAGLELRDYQTLIEAMRGVDARLVIAAGSPWSHDRFEYGGAVPPNVHVGAYSVPETRELYRHASFVVVPVHPTLRACGGNVVLEAWGLGKAVIVSRSAGMFDYVTPGENGLMAEPGNVAAMRTQIERLLAAPEEAARLGASGQALVRSSWNLDGFLAFLEREYSALLGLEVRAPVA